MRWTFEMRCESIPTLQQRFEWALQRQNARIADGWPSARVSLPRQQVAIVLLSAAGFALSTLGLRIGMRPGGFLVACTIIFACTLIIGVFFARFTQAMRRFSGRTLASHAARTYAAVARKAPYTIEYELDGASVTARAAALGVTRQVDLAKAAVLLAADGVLYAYKRKHATNPTNMIYLPPDIQRELLAHLATLGITPETIDGPTNGYVPPLPEARVTTT